MPWEIHAFMQNPDDPDLVAAHAIKNNMRASLRLKISGPDLGTSFASVQKHSDSFGMLANLLQVGSSLVNTPKGQRKIDNTTQIILGATREDVIRTHLDFSKAARLRSKKRQNQILSPSHYSRHQLGRF